MDVFDLLPYPALIAAAIAAVLAALALRLFRRPRVRLERRALLTAAELEMLRLLRSLLPDRHVNCQVSMGALLKPRPRLDRRSHSLSRNKVSQKVVDFVVMDPATGTVDAVIELDDATHDARKDAARDRLLAQGGYRVIRIPSRPRPTRDSVAAALSPLRSARPR